MTLLDFQLVLGRHNIRPPHFASKVSYSASPQTSAKCPRGAPCSDAASPFFLGSVFFFRFNRLPSFPSMIRLPSVFPSFPFFHIPQSLLIIIGYFFFFYK